MYYNKKILIFGFDNFGIGVIGISLDLLESTTRVMVNSE